MKTIIFKERVNKDFSDIIIEDILISNKFNMVHITYPKYKTIEYVKDKIKDNMDKDVIYGIFKKKSLFNEILFQLKYYVLIFKGNNIKVNYNKENIFIIESLDNEKFREYTSLFINAINTENIIQVNIYENEYICNILEYEYWMNERGYNIKIKMIPYNKFKKEV